MIFTWGNEPQSETLPIVNTWQGSFPKENTNADGFSATSPVKGFEPNGYGLYDMSGNVAEWCSDIWRRSPTALSENSYQYTLENNLRSIRGGGWNANEKSCTVSEGFKYNQKEKRSSSS